MRRILVACAAVALVTFTGVASAGFRADAGKPPFTGPCARLYTQAEHARFARSVFNHRGHIDRKAQRRNGHLRKCQHTPEATQNATQLTRRLRRNRTVRAQRQGLTPFNCGGSWWAIPCSIIACESGFSWTAQNPSGANGPYQLLGKSYNGRPVTVSSPHYVHHQVAHDLWAGGAGRSHWVC